MNKSYPSNTNSSNKEKSDMVESRFKEWLNKHKIPYWYIQQDLQTFSQPLKEYFGGKRPDFMILIPSFGFILVDAEYKKLNEEYKNFALDCEETAKYSNLQRNFNLQVWYALSNESTDYKTWFWIPVSKVLEHGEIEKHKSSKSGTDFFAIPSTEFTQIAHDDSLGRLFSKLFTKEQ